MTGSEERLKKYMLNLEKGMYAKDKDGHIFKLIGFEDVSMINFTTWKTDSYPLFVNQKDILKASHNIIDLIEVGDVLVINNEKYEVIYDESYEKLGILIPNKKCCVITHSALEYIFKKYDNVKIVTHEQFESLSYKVGE